MTDPVRIRCFADQDVDREIVELLATREAVDLLLQMDMVTSGGDGLAEYERTADPDVAESYAAFRAWFAPRLMQAIMVSVGRVLQAGEVTHDGRVAIDEKRLHLAVAIDERAGLAGRLNWIAGELPSLHEVYGQLYDDEAVEAVALCAEADALDLGTDDGWSRGLAMWPRLEELYKWAQPGARISRADPDAVAAARSTLEAWAERIGEAEARKVARLAVLAGERDATDIAELRASITDCNTQLGELAARRSRLDRAATETQGQIERLSERLTELLGQAGAAGIDVE